MPTPQYIALANLTIASSATSITFSSISQSYRDLVIIADTNSPFIYGMRFNSDTGTNYSYVQMGGANGSTFSTTGSETFSRIGYSSASRTILNVNIFDYSATNKHKTAISRDSSAGFSVRALASRWANTSAINSITLFISDGSSFSAGSTFALYGVK